MNELEIVILIVFSINCILNVLVIAYFRIIIGEEKHLDALFTRECEYFYKASKCRHEDCGMRGLEKEK